VDFRALTEAICEGIVRGNAGVVSAFSTERERRHALADDVQTNMNKVYELDKEMVLVKGMLVALIGKDADGTTGLVPRMDSDMRELKTDVTVIKGQVREISDNQEAMAVNIRSILATQGQQSSWMDGWKGVGVAIAVGSCAITFVGGIIAALMWLYQHGMPAVGQHTSMF
jgi:hypothetical protein